MKIGIMTYHRSINYGAVMQSFALSRRLSEIKNVEVEIIDYMSLKMDIYYKLFTLYRGRNGFWHFRERFEMYHAFRRGINQLPLSKGRLVTDNASKFYRYIQDRYDIIIVGSDAVWNYEKRGLPNPYFLTENVKTRKISYAASCNGIDYSHLNNSKLSILKRSFEQFEYLGVRDMLTEMVVSKALGQQIAKHNCDPTFLLDFEQDGLGEEFISKLSAKLCKKYGWDTSKKHIGLMLSNLNGNLAKILVAKLKEKYGKTHQIVSVYSYCPYADIPYISDLTPFEWSRIFSLFDITFSKYFHGMLLSIKNGTPVMSLSAEHHIEGIPAKVEDVLKRMDLMEFYWPAKNESNIEWGKFMTQVDEFILNPPKEKMKKAVDNERQYAKEFFGIIESISAFAGD